MHETIKRIIIGGISLFAFGALLFGGVMLFRSINSQGDTSTTNAVTETDTASYSGDVDWGSLSTTAVNLTDAGYIIKESGNYIFSGNSSGQIVVETSEAVQITLDGVKLNVSQRPAIYISSNNTTMIKLADGSSNVIDMQGADSKLDGAIYSNGSLLFVGAGNLDLQTSTGDGVVASNITIESGSFSVATAGKAFTTTGKLAVSGGTLKVSTCEEGLEGAQVIISGGTIDIYATDDGINASSDDSDDIYISISGGDISVEVADGDTDAIDSNGDLYVSGGTLRITARVSSFDFVGSVSYTGGIIYVNGTRIDKIENSTMPARR